jgi:DNA-binding beta-propeller fold protein YncE
VKGKNTIAVIDPANNKVLEAWPCARGTGPHGIAIAPESNGLLVACAGKLVAVKTHTVWIAYKKGDQCFVQPFTPTK